MKKDELLSRYHTVLEALPEHAFILSESGRYIDVFGGEDNNTGFDCKSYIGRTLHDIAPPDMADKFCSFIQTALAQNRTYVAKYVFSGEHMIELPEGLKVPEEIWFEGRIKPLPLRDQGERTVLWIAKNITEHHYLEKRLKDLAEKDELTGIPNRRAFIQYMSQMLSITRRSNKDISMLMIDIDLFKNINDTYGHVIGDYVLKHAANISERMLGDAYFIGRLGGEEFAVVLKDLDIHQAARLAEDLRRNIESEPYLMNGESITITVSIGVTQIQETDSSFTDAFIRADKAMYRAKLAGRNQVCLFSDHIVHPPGKTGHGATSRHVILPLNRGPFQNNGASPWYYEMNIGHPHQSLKMCFDSGSNFNWVTSTLCSESGCVHYGEQRFNINQSDSFVWVDQQPQSIGFGPWGTMTAETGQDQMFLRHVKTPLSTVMYLAEQYQGEQFQELDWDGGIGLASHQYGAGQLSGGHPFRLQPLDARNMGQQCHFFAHLLELGLVSPDNLTMAFNTTVLPGAAIGEIAFGMLDDRYADSREYVFLPWASYAPAADYLWGTDHANLYVDGKPYGTNMHFAVDSGSSQFKGDKAVLSSVYQAVSNRTAGMPEPMITLNLSDDNDQVYAEFKIPGEVYNCEIEAGSSAGQVVAQFQGLDDATNMLLVGSVLMDHLYTIYEYEPDSQHELTPKGIWLFNKPNGKRIIQTVQTAPASIFSDHSLRAASC